MYRKTQSQIRLERYIFDFDRELKNKYRFKKNNKKNKEKKDYIKEAEWVKKINKSKMHLRNNFITEIENLDADEKISKLKEKQGNGKMIINYFYYQRRKEKNKIIDNTSCFVCGKPAYCMHHIVPLCRGGNNLYSNLIPVCKDCHKKIHPFIV